MNMRCRRNICDLIRATQTSLHFASDRGTNLLNCVSNWLRDLLRPIVSVEGGLRTIRQLPCVKYWMKFEPKTNLALVVSGKTRQVIGMYVRLSVLFLQVSPCPGMSQERRLGLLDSPLSETLLSPQEMPIGYKYLFFVFTHRCCIRSNISKYHKCKVHGGGSWNRGSIISVAVNRLKSSNSHELWRWESW